ncbi:MAG: geranylgeranylglycerol-phosphate geranylgeranyltransferase [Winogradskyella sp.]|nr:geranylgeranylglycerol-phosphate geranylgeranyltransferase [Winogradskyella sp.]
MTAFFQLIRWKNLLLIAITQYLIKYGLLDPFIDDYGVLVTLNHFGFLILVIATVCIAAAGYVINDIYDVEADKINKPEKVIVGKSLTERTCTTLFIVLNIIGVVLGYYLSHVVGKNGYFIIFFVSSALLYIYATYLKQILLVGNIIISILVAFSLLVVGIFELLPVITPSNSQIQTVFFKIILDYAIFAFAINLLREIVKDIQDIDGDHKLDMRTLPIVLGRKRASDIAFVLSILLTGGIVYYIITFLFKQQIVVAYFLIMVIAPLIFTSIKLHTSDTKKDYALISNLLKVIMLTGILSITLYRFVI